VFCLFSSACRRGALRCRPGGLDLAVAAAVVLLFGGAVSGDVSLRIESLNLGKTSERAPPGTWGLKLMPPVIAAKVLSWFFLCPLRESRWRCPAHTPRCRGTRVG